MSVSILGGGIGGLSSLHFLSLRQNIGRQIKLYEKAARFGGWIYSKRNNESDVVFETGPRSLRPVGDAGLTTLDLIEKLGIKESVVPVHKTHVAAKNRMVFAKNQLCLLPNGPAGFFKTMPPFSRPLLFAGLRDIFTGHSKTPLEDESIYDFFNRRFGSELADYVISPIICGICAGNAKEISVKFLFKEIFEKEQKYGGFVKGIVLGRHDKKPDQIPIVKTEFMRSASVEGWSMYRIQDGLEKIPQAIVDSLQHDQNCELNLNSPCDQITFKGNEVSLSINGSTQSTSHVISTLPAFSLAAMIKEQHPTLSNELENIQYVDVAVINLLYSKPDLLQKQGFGVLVAPCENLPVLGIIFDSCITDSKGNTVLTVMAGGSFFEKYYSKDSSKEFLLKTALENVSKILKIDEKPDIYDVHLHRKCIPQYKIGHHARVERIRKYIADHKLPLSVGGAAFDGVGVNDVIYSSKNIVNQLEF